MEESKLFAEMEAAEKALNDKFVENVEAPQEKIK